MGRTAPSDLEASRPTSTLVDKELEHEPEGVAAETNVEGEAHPPPMTSQAHSKHPTVIATSPASEKRDPNIVTWDGPEDPSVDLYFN